MLLGVLCLAVAIAGISQIVGHIGREGDDENGMVFRTSPTAQYAFVCATAEDANDLAARFDRDQFQSRVRENARTADRETARALGELDFSICVLGNELVVKYYFVRWGRYRFDLSQFRYTFDLNDPIAQSRNAVVYQAVADAGKVVANENEMIRSCYPLP
jgi:hypothetical protein